MRIPISTTFRKHLGLLFLVQELMELLVKEVVVVLVWDQPEAASSSVDQQSQVAWS